MIYVLVGKSGAGKTTIGKRLGIPELKSHTTRPKRTSEKGDEYYFISEEEFDKIDFLERIKIGDYRYGSSLEELNKYVNSDENCYAIYNREGAIKLKERYPDKVILIQIWVCDYNCAKRMISNRDDKEAVRKRIELNKDPQFDITDIADEVVSNDHDDLISALIKIKLLIRKRGGGIGK